MYYIIAAEITITFIFFYISVYVFKYNNIILYLEFGVNSGVQYYFVYL